MKAQKRHFYIVGPPLSLLLSFGCMFDMLESHNLEGLCKSYFYVSEQFLIASPSNLKHFFYNDTCPYTGRSKIQEVEEQGKDIN